MPALEMSIHCLCLIVPDRAAGTVHVLMPKTHRHHQHVVRVVDPELGQPKGRSMEGLILRLGPGGTGPGSANTDLIPTVTPVNRAEIVNLDPLAGTLDRQVLNDPQKIVCRIELRAGKLHEIFSEAAWEIGDDDREIAMATRATWRIDEITDMHLEWKPFGNGGSEPFDSFSDVVDADGVIRFAIYHVTEDALPPSRFGTLMPEAVKEHFRAFYKLYGIDNPPEKRLPRKPRPFQPMQEFIRELATAARKKRNPHAIEQLARFAELAGRAAEDEANTVRDLLFFIRNYNCPTGKGTFT